MLSRLERRFILTILLLWCVLLIWLAVQHSPSKEGATRPSRSLLAEQQDAAAAASHYKQGRPVWWHAPFLSGGGYSTEAVQFVLGLSRAKLVPPGRLWISQHGDLPSEEVMAGMEAEDRAQLLNLLTLGMSAVADPRRDTIIICHSVPGAWSLPDPLFETTRCPPYPLEEATYVVGRTMFETDSLPPDHVERCNMLDEIWLPTEIHKELYWRSGVTRPQLTVIPEAVDTRQFDPARHKPLPLPIGQRVFGRIAGIAAGQQAGPHGASAQHAARSLLGKAGAQAASREGVFVFLSIFKWEERKAWDVLLRAYLEEFGATERVMLLTLTKPFHSDTDFKEQMQAWAASHLVLPSKGSNRGADWAALPPVYVQHEHIRQEDLPRLYKAADAFVLPSRGEGWGRPHVEAMSMGLPVLATNWSGPTAFLDDTVGYPIAVEGLVVAGPNEGAFAGRRWAQPSVAHLRRLMRRVVERPEEARTRGAAARRRMVERYSPEVVARVVAERLGDIDKLLGRAGRRQSGRRQQQHAQQQGRWTT